MLGVSPAVASAQLDDGALANVETELEMGPLDLPGHELGPRTRKPAVAPTPVPEDVVEAPDWFGGKPWWEWSRATGSWGGARAWLEEHGITLEGSYTLDWSSVWSGGLRNVASTRSLTDFNVTFDLERLAGLAGGEIFFDFYSSDPRGGSRDVGDLHGVSNIETGENVDQIAEFWYQQWIFDRVARFKFGKIDANSEFTFIEPASTFLNSAAAISTNMLAFPTYPDPAMGANLFVYPTSFFYVGAGIYDGATQDGYATGRRGPATFFSDSKSDSWFSIVEAGFTWTEVGPLKDGRVAAGGWHHSGDFDRFDGGVDEGTSGFYFVAQQRLMGEEGGEGRGLYAFARYAWADKDVSAAHHHIGGGLSLQGTFPGREEDEAGLFVSTLFLSDATGAPFEGDETAVELYYRIHLTTFIHLTPDLQWISNPSGDPAVKDAVVGALRLEVDF